MVTTAGDYARFLGGILKAKGQRKVTVNEMLQPQIAINYRRMFGPDAWNLTDEYQDIALAWRLGWGRFDTSYGRAFFHTGHSIGWQNYTVTYIDKGIGIVMLSNSDNFESVAEEIAKMAIGAIYSPYEWLGYVPVFDEVVVPGESSEETTLAEAQSIGTESQQPQKTKEQETNEDSRKPIRRRRKRRRRPHKK